MPRPLTISSVVSIRRVRNSQNDSSPRNVQSMPIAAAPVYLYRRRGSLAVGAFAFSIRRMRGGALSSTLMDCTSDTNRFRRFGGEIDVVFKPMEVHRLGAQ